MGEVPFNPNDRETEEFKVEVPERQGEIHEAMVKRTDEYIRMREARGERSEYDTGTTATASEKPQGLAARLAAAKGAKAGV